jgi:hypothetical protein
MAGKFAATFLLFLAKFSSFLPSAIPDSAASQNANQTFPGLFEMLMSHDLADGGER